MFFFKKGPRRKLTPFQESSFSKRMFFDWPVFSWSDDFGGFQVQDVSSRELRAWLGGMWTMRVGYHKYSIHIEGILFQTF